jgi:hypothetical protein
MVFLWQRNPVLVRVLQRNRTNARYTTSRRDLVVWLNSATMAICKAGETGKRELFIPRSWKLQNKRER